MLFSKFQRTRTSVALRGRSSGIQPRSTRSCALPFVIEANDSSRVSPHPSWSITANHRMLLTTTLTVGFAPHPEMPSDDATRGGECADAEWRRRFRGRGPGVGAATEARRERYQYGERDG